MPETLDYEAMNRAQWDELAPLHAASPDYKLSTFVTDSKYISDTLKFDVPLLGDVTGLRCLHLQCHIGSDTLSLARLGASSVVGLDFSNASLKEAAKLAKATNGTGGEKLRFVEASVYDGLGVLEPESFDLVYTGIGALCWLYSIEKWAAIVAAVLKPGGRLFIREGHPVLWSLDDKNDKDLVIQNPYFEQEEPTVYTVEGSYVETGDYEFRCQQSAEFNHGIGQIVQSLIQSDMRISGMVEHTSVPWPALPKLMALDDRGEYSLTNAPWRLPHSYTLQAVKN